MRASLGLAAALIAVSMAPTARGTPADDVAQLMRMFQTYCVANNSAPQAVLAAARRDGFAERPGTDDDARPDEVVLYLERGDHAYGLYSTQRPFAGYNSDVCAMSLQPSASAASTLAAVSAWVGLPPSRTTPGSSVIFGYTDGAQGRRTLESLEGPALRQTLAEGRARVVTVDIANDRNVGGIMYTVPYGGVSH